METAQSDQNHDFVCYMYMFFFNLQQKEAEEAMKKQQEDAKWKDIPEWKKKMIMEKERKKAEEAQAAVDHDKEEREAKIKAMPTWKRNLVKKKSTSDETNNNGM